MSPLHTFRRAALPAVLGTVTLLAGCASAGSTPQVEGTRSALTQTAPSTTSQPTPSAASPAVTSRSAHPCGFKPKAPKTYAHVLWIFLENHAYGAAKGNMPYLDGIGAKCGLARNYHSIGHPSLPNYIAATSGGTHGLARDCEPAKCSVSGRSLFGQLTRHGKTWKGYADSMSGRCSRTSYGEYAARHNPAVYYKDVSKLCQTADVPLQSRTAGLRHDLNHSKLPAFSFITPDLCHDSHDCKLSSADQWLSKWLPRIFGSTIWSSGRTALFVTFDEGEGYGGACAPSASANDSCHVVTWVFGPSVHPGTRSNLHYSHYSLLRSTEQMLGLKRYLGKAAHVRSMRAGFRL